MSRPLRIEYPGAVYHVMNRGNSRQKTFLSKEDYRTFLNTLSETHDLWGIDVFAFCLMENHYHLCLRTPQGNLSRIMRHLGGLYTQRFNRAHAREGVLFRGRYKAILVDADEYLASVVRYIHLNPVEAGIAKVPEGYPWSSHAIYLKRRPAPAWLKVQEVLGKFGSVKEFQEFVLSGNEGAIKEFYRQSRQGPLLGREVFREQIQRRLSRIDREHPRYERVELRPTAERVLKQVAEVYEGHVGDLLRGRRGINNEARRVAMYLVKRLCDLTLQETAERFRVGSYGVIGWACHGVRSRMQIDERLKKRVESIEKRVYQQKI